MRESTLWAKCFFSPIDKDMSVTFYYYLFKEGKKIKLLKFTQSVNSLNVIKGSPK